MAILRDILNGILRQDKMADEKKALQEQVKKMQVIIEAAKKAKKT